MLAHKYLHNLLLQSSHFLKLCTLLCAVQYLLCRYSPIRRAGPFFSPQAYFLSLAGMV